MKPESEAWSELRRRAAGCIRPGFADRVIRAARMRATPTFLTQFAWSAATAALCFGAVAVFAGRQPGVPSGDGPGWQEITSAEAAGNGLAQ